MSEYQKIKARAMELQREREAEMQRERARKAEREKQLAKDEEVREKRLEQLSREARARELMAANARLVGAQNGRASPGVQVEYDPFAEDERPHVPIAGPSKPAAFKPKTPGNAGTRGNGGVKTTYDGPTTGATKVDRPKNSRPDKSPPPLGRKEKAAKLFAQKAKKASGADSVFSVRALVDGRDGAPGYASGSASPSRLPTLAQKHVATGTMKKRGKKGGEVIGQLRKLCPERETRDRRTIDEIQRDIKTRKGILPGDTDRTKSNGQAGDSRSLSPAKILGKPKAPPIPTSARPAPSSSSRLPPSARLPPAHRRRSPSFSSSSSSSPPPPRKRPRSGRSPSIDPLDVSATIQSLFRRPGAPTQRYFDEDEESGGSSDMEAGLSDVEKEEERARRIARKEDEEAEREEREHRLVKERMRKEREREKMKGR